MTDRDGRRLAVSLFSDAGRLDLGIHAREVSSARSSRQHRSQVNVCARAWR